MLYRAFAFISVLGLVSCLDSKDYNLDTLTLTPTLAVPIAFGDIGILDLITDKDSSYLKVYPDGLLYFSYGQTLASQDIRSLFTLPNNNSSTIFPLPAGTLPPSTSDAQFATISKVLDLNMSPEQLSELLLKTGSLAYAIALAPATNPALPFEINVTLTDVVDKNNQQPLTFTASSGSGSKPLKDYVIKMNKNKFNIKLDLILKKRTSSVFIQSNTNVSIQLSFTSMDFAYIKGFFGDQTTTLPAQTIDLSVFSSSLNKSKISLAQPVIKMSVRNDYTVPCEINFTKLEGKKTGATLPLQTNPTSPVNLGFPAVFGGFANTLVTVTNPGPVLNFSPTQLAYTATARINRGLTSGNNFLADTSKLKVTLTAEVPLYGQASGISLVDTVNIDLGNTNQSDVSTASLKLKAENEMPLDAYIQFYLTDANFKILDSLFTSNQTYLVKASSVTGTGELQSAGLTDVLLSLDGSKISKLFSSRHIILRSRLNTTRDSNGVPENVKFKSVYKLKLKMGLLAKLKISAK